MNNVFRIVETKPLDAYMNMALDEALFLSFCDDPKALPIFRIYRWVRPAFSLGVSQDPRLNLDLGKCRDRDFPFVRRITGGGIILHDQEITYSLVVPQGFFGSPRDISASFKAICEFLLVFYRKLGLAPGFAVDYPFNGTVGKATKFCFSGREKYDIVVEGKKIGGNAQKRNQKAIFQHGSIPISVDHKRLAEFSLGECDNNLDGVAALDELKDTLPSPDCLIRLLKESFIEAFNAQDALSEIKNEELMLAEVLKKEKYSSDNWNIERHANIKPSEKASVA